MNREHLLKNLGLAYRAQAVVSGEEFSLNEIKSGKAKLVFLASDAGKNTTKRVSDKSAFYKVELINTFTTEELSRAIGKTNRKVLAVTRVKFAALLKDTLTE
ncbi:MAG: ribosomal L7Ae/L30e/S12e/Gadd45 family protein [Firmicutes bacterium]|nr:ribosomal L7Ae/L30e/S12e/Gadd45 family protein [Bacillota bacterium]